VSSAAGAFKTNTILCSNDRLAIGLLAACYERAGGSARLRVARCGSPSMTTIRSPGSPARALTTAAANDYAAACGRAAQRRSACSAVIEDAAVRHRPDRVAVSGESRLRSGVGLIQKFTRVK
jgi:hypothetical protein